MLDDESIRRELIECGALYEDDGDWIIDPEKMEAYSPELWAAALEEINNRLAMLVESGAITMTYEPEIDDDGNLELNPHFYIPEEVDLRLE